MCDLHAVMNLTESQNILLSYLLTEESQANEQLTLCEQNDRNRDVDPMFEASCN